jgi:hypothetical protein
MTFAASLMFGANTSIMAESKSSNTLLLSGCLSVEVVTSDSTAAVGDIWSMEFSESTAAASRDTSPIREILLSFTSAASSRVMHSLYFH